MADKVKKEDVQDPDTGDILVGVYGTLKFGFPNYETYMRGASHVGIALVEGLMLHHGGYPMVVKQPTGYELKRNSLIAVHVYSVDTERLARLDQLESHPVFYERRHIRTQWGYVWVYFGHTKRYWQGTQKVIWDGVWRGPKAEDTPYMVVDFNDGGQKPKVRSTSQAPLIDKETGEVSFGKKKEKNSDTNKTTVFVPNAAGVWVPETEAESEEGPPAPTIESFKAPDGKVEEWTLHVKATEELSGFFPRVQSL